MKPPPRALRRSWGKKPGKQGEGSASLESIGRVFPSPCAGRFHNPRTSGGRRLLPLLLKTFPAEDRPSLCRLEGNRGLLAALGTSGSSLSLRGRLPGNRCTQNGNTFCFACFAALWFVLELLVVKKQLFAGGENKVRTAVDTLQYLVLEFHPSPHSPVASRALGKANRFPCARLRTELLRTPLEQLPL
jgi:hypothetical protein